jgi:Spherulation-specific family 4
MPPQGLARSKAIAIINPDNGPVSIGQWNAGAIQCVAALKKKNIVPIGYVPSGYGAGNLKTIKAQIDLWVSLYNVSGIFIDEGGSWVRIEPTLPSKGFLLDT